MFNSAKLSAGRLAFKSTRMADKHRSRILFEEEREVIDGWLEDSTCYDCGHPAIDWLYAYMKPCGEMIHICCGQKDTLSPKEMQEKHPPEDFEWVFLDLTYYTVDAVELRKSTTQKGYNEILKNAAIERQKNARGIFASSLDKRAKGDSRTRARS